MKTDDHLRGISRILDHHIDPDARLHPGHLRRIRIGKIAEELGEVEAELIALEGSNPRKPNITGDGVLVAMELLDVAVAALAAYNHLFPEDSATTALAARSARVHRRLEE